MPRASDGPAPSLSPGRGIPIRSCSRRGLPCRPGHPVRGGLLPHPFTLTLLRLRLRRAKPCVALAEQGGLLSVALSLGSPPAGVTRRLVAVEPGLSSTSRKRDRDRPAVWSELRVGDGEAGVKVEPQAPVIAGRARRLLSDCVPGWPVLTTGHDSKLGLPRAQPQQRHQPRPGLAVGGAGHVGLAPVALESVHHGGGPGVVGSTGGATVTEPG